MRAGQYAAHLCAAVVLFLSLSWTVPLSFGATSLTITRLRCEYKSDPIGIDVPSPRLGWEIVSSERSTMQSAYEIQVAVSAEKLTRSKLLWDSGKRDSEASMHVPYEGPALNSSQRYYWRVEVWDNRGRDSGWSEPAYWEMGLLQPSDWKAHWIRPNLQEDEKKSNPSPMLRRIFELRREHCQREALRLGYGALSTRTQRPTGRRSIFHSGMDSLRFSLPIPNLRCHFPIEGGKKLSCGISWRRLVSRENDVG